MKSVNAESEIKLHPSISELHGSSALSKNFSWYIGMGSALNWKHPQPSHKDQQQHQ